MSDEKKEKSGSATIQEAYLFCFMFPKLAMTKTKQNKTNK